ncbi:TonB-dependent receptor [uncultured Pontibacter sp.]|uniref:TonB-dependent receptor n=1 Tax=uncultured Pontibacter sp. TaxID=453356 RepID=UPI002632F05B|nr:TonB-dependent receptor [uncultured Pontibacter sp.]
MFKFLLLACVLSFLFVHAATSQSTLYGTVKDENAVAIPGASVHLLNTTLGATSDSRGSYSITGIPAGTYQVRTSALGYATLISLVTISEATQQLDVQLREESRQLGQVTVTAQKREEDLQWVPFSVSTLSGRQVQEYRLWNVRDISAIIPNLYAADPGDNRPVISIRGITTTSYDPAVATYIDGVNQFSLDTYMADLLDIERIEVLRGPQGTLYGRNAMGGVMHFITREPDNKLGGSAEVSAGNFGQQRYSGSLQTPVVKDQLLLGIASLHRRQNGFYTNRFDNSNYDRQQVWMGNYYLKYLASPNLNLTLNVKHSANRNSGAFPLVMGVEEALEKPFELNQNAVSEMVDNTFNASLSLHYTSRHFQLSSHTAYQRNYRYYDQPLDGDFLPIDGISIVNDFGRDWNKVQVRTQELRFTSPAASTSPLRWTAGFYGFHSDSPVKQGVYFGEDAAMVGAPFSDFSSVSINRGESYGAALYSQATYRISPRWEVTTGLRYDYERKSLQVRGELWMSEAEPIITQADTAAKASFRAFSPKLSLSFLLAENHQLYGTYSRGFRAGGITQLSSDPAQPPLYAYDPEKSDNFEAGVKSLFLENRLRLNIAAYYVQVSDAQVPVLVMPEALVITRNAGRLKSKGIEAELASVLLQGLEAAYTFGYTHAVYTHLSGVSEGEEVRLDGNRQIFTPDITSMLALQYSYRLYPEKNVRMLARGEWHYLGTQYFDLANQLEQQGYHLLNARAGFSYKGYELMLWGRNLTNKRYIAYAYDFGAVRLGNPRTYGITGSYRF